MRTIGNRLLIKPLDAKKEGVIYVADPQKTTAEVLAVGKGYYMNGAWLPMDVNVGDVIYFQGGIQLEPGILVISEKEVLAIKEET